ncbi:MAG: 2-C-methyl-D-erythritol 2,4-cyclodiphosphate synthase [Bacteroidetes bacterium]|nr:2-C-methyl-D-erythritol 2,4-cyclodiphosphate synthase [Bacteroidota bacterium]MBM3424216.1 2-C-methyl-D-erythritol 2,4-cyclodiphosphate synthase [Bacteroidota bacterium]
MQLRIGFGVDVHRLVEGRPLIVGGVTVPSSFGAYGHSDADVLLHAICDALLGALNLRDIGFHFSDNDPAYKGIDSGILLTHTMAMVSERGFSVINLDSTVILEQPKLNPHIPKMQQIVAGILKISKENISIKATTHESVDSFGTGAAIKAYATVLLQKLD